jgi:hypothetical protein
VRGAGQVERWQRFDERRRYERMQSRSRRGQEVNMGGKTADPRMVEQNSERANIFVPIKRLNGDEIFEVECGINTLNQSVTWAQIKTGPPVTDDDVKFLRAQGLCSEP